MHSGSNGYRADNGRILFVFHPLYIRPIRAISFLNGLILFCFLAFLDSLAHAANNSLHATILYKECSRHIENILSGYGFDSRIMLG